MRCRVLQAGSRETAYSQSRGLRTGFRGVFTDIEIVRDSNHVDAGHLPFYALDRCGQFRILVTLVVRLSNERGLNKHRSQIRKPLQGGKRGLDPISRYFDCYDMLHKMLAQKLPPTYLQGRRLRASRVQIEIPRTAMSITISRNPLPTLGGRYPALAIIVKCRLACCILTAHQLHAIEQQSMNSISDRRLN